MFIRLSYKQKLKWLGGISLLALLICYQMAIKRTVREYLKDEVQVETTDVGTFSSMSVAELQNRNVQASNLYNLYLLDTLNPEKNLLSIASNFCKTNNLRLKEYKPIRVGNNDSSKVLIRIVTVEGSFINCLKFLFELETRKNSGRVSSAEFNTFKDTQDKKMKLECIIYIQNLISY
jgi:hypothetical protein